MIEYKATWDVLGSVNKLLSCADTRNELRSIEKKLHFEIGCIAAAIYGDIPEVELPADGEA